MNIPRISRRAIICWALTIFFPCFLQALATDPLARGRLDNSRNLLGSKPTLTLRLLLDGLEQGAFGDSEQRALLRVVADLAAVDAHSVILESLEYPPPAIIECKSNRYVCDGFNFVDRETYLAALNQTCTHHAEMDTVYCNREVLSRSLYETIWSGLCICEAEGASATSASSVQTQNVEKNTVAMVKIRMDTSSDAHAATNRIISAFDASNSQKRSDALQASNLGSISIELAEKPDFEPEKVVYFWSVSPWHDCSAECGGGVQSRTVLCKSSHQREQVGNWLCDSSGKPHQWQQCNPQSCDLQLFNFEERRIKSRLCDSVCLSGVQYGSVHCVGENGYIGDSSYCSDWKGSPSTTTCGQTQCKGNHMWDVEGWGKCDKACGGGKMLLKGECSQEISSSEGNSTCNDVIHKWTFCNSIPCNQYMWDVSPWGECSAPCDGDSTKPRLCTKGKMHRNVACKSSNGTKVDEENCGPQPKESAWCNLNRCDFCKDNDCSKRGLCTNGKCTCYQGYKGDLCEIHDTCSGVLDSNKNCCETGIIDKDGTCCQKDAVVSKKGECCKFVDGEGTCMGNSSFISFNNRGCDTILDAEGACCTSGYLDDCGVCDGDSSSCGTVVDVIFQVGDTTLIHKSRVVPQYVVFFAKILGISQGDALEFQNTSIIQKSASAMIHASMYLSPNILTKTKATLSSHFIWATLYKHIGDEIPGYGLFDSIQKVTRRSICGNYVCELGERVIYAREINGSYTKIVGCHQDCSIPYKECKVGLIGKNERPKFCSGRGTCFTSSGECDCWDGYTGDDCSQCTQGYIRSNSICIPQYTIEGTRFAPTYGASTLNQTLIILIALVSLLAFVSLVIGIFALKRKANSTTDGYFSKLKPTSENVDANVSTSKKADCLDIARGLSYHAPRALSNALVPKFNVSTFESSSSQPTTLSQAPQNEGTSYENQLSRDDTVEISLDS